MMQKCRNCGLFPNGNDPNGSLAWPELDLCFVCATKTKQPSPTDPGYWTAGMVSFVLTDHIHCCFRETVQVNRHETPNLTTTNRFKLTMANGDEFWITVTPAEKHDSGMSGM